MHTSLVLTVIGPDRLGLVESVSAVVAERGGNWLESSMAHLAGQFAGILHISVPAESVAELTAELTKLQDSGLHVVVQHSDAQVLDQDGSGAGKKVIVLELVGQDRAGIVRDISSAIATHGVNVADLKTSCEPAPMSGEMLFKATAKLHILAGTSLDELRAKLEVLASDLMVEMSLDEAD